MKHPNRHTIVTAWSGGRWGDTGDFFGTVPYLISGTYRGRHVNNRPGAWINLAGDYEHTA